MATRDGVAISVNVFIALALMKNFGASEVGFFALIRSIIGSVECFFRFPTDTLIPRVMVSDGIRSKILEIYLNIFGLQQVTILVLGLVTLVVCYALSLNINPLILIVCLLLTLTRLTKTILSYILIGLKDFRTYNFGLIVLSTLSLVLSLILYYFEYFTILNIFILQLIAEIFCLIIFWKSAKTICYRNAKITDARAITDTLKAEIALYKAQILSFFNDHFIILILGSNSLNQLGAFHTLKVGAESLSRVIFTAFINVYSVDLFKAANSTKTLKYSKIVREYWYLKIVGCVVVVAIITPLQTIELYWLDLNSIRFTELVLIIIAGIFQSSSSFFNQIFIARHRTDLVFQTTLQAALLGLILLGSILTTNFSLIYWYFGLFLITYLLRFQKYREVL